MSNSKQRELIRYRYDPLDQLTGDTQSDSPTRQHYYCKKRLVTEIQGAIGHSIVQHGDFLLAQQQHQQGERVSTLLATDLQRSVLHTLKKNTEREAIAYSPYGHRPALNGLLSLLGFNGERPDPVTGHYLLGNGYRAFNPFFMRFNSPDSLSPFEKGGFNSYAYCKGDPANFIDPTGHFLIKYIRNKMAERAIRKEIKTLIPKIQASASELRLSYRDSIMQKQISLVKERHPAGLEIKAPRWSDDLSKPPSFTVNDDIARSVFLRTLEKKGTLSSNDALSEIGDHYHRAAGRTLQSTELPATYHHAAETSHQLWTIANKPNHQLQLYEHASTRAFERIRKS